MGDLSLGPRSEKSPDDSVAAIELRLFLEAIYERYGYDLREYAVPSMKRRVQLALGRSGLPDLGALQHRILVDPEGFARVLADLTVQVTELFRDPPFYRDFRERVVPVLRTYPVVNIWLAGCATGEEAYSTAIALKEEGLLDRAQIYATDLSAGALERAKQGVFSAPDFAAVVATNRQAGGSETLSSHATIAYGQIAFKEALREKILFCHHDLVSDYVFAEMQVIFCRNVLIYFGRSLRDRVLGKFAKSLCRGGFLCLGSSERLPAETREIFAELMGEQRIYRLREGS
jgi:chemotaxis protein methyltransferase CheR